MTTERNLFTDPIPPHERTTCQVSVPDLKVCRALATDLRALADQLWEQGYREYTRIRLDRETRKIVVELASEGAVE